MLGERQTSSDIHEVADRHDQSLPSLSGLYAVLWGKVPF